MWPSLEAKARGREHGGHYPGSRLVPTSCPYMEGMLHRGNPGANGGGGGSSRQEVGSRQRRCGSSGCWDSS